MQIFNVAEEYHLFEKLLLDAKELVGMRVLAYTLMPNHWHLVLHPQNDKDMGIFMHRLTNTHTRQVHVRTRTIGSGYLYQGRYKSFLVDSDVYFLTLIKYVERNSVRAKLVEKCEDWQWGSAWRRIHGTKTQQELLALPPFPLPSQYRRWINTPDRKDELEKIRYCMSKGAPYGRGSWVEKMVMKYNLETTLRSVGRPKNN